MSTIIRTGIGAGYLVYIAVLSHARPEWWAKLQAWWRRTGPAAWDGKPITCGVCMSFWISLFLSVPRWATEARAPRKQHLTRWATEAFATAAISLAVFLVLGRLRKE